MDFRTLCTLASAVSLPYGLAFVLVPVACLNVYGVTSIDASFALLGRFHGAEILMYAAATFGLRGLDSAPAQSAAARALAAATLAGMGVSILSMQSGLVSALGWSNVALFALFSLAWIRLGWMGSVAR